MSAYVCSISSNGSGRSPGSYVQGNGGGSGRKDDSATSTTGGVLGRDDLRNQRLKLAVRLLDGPRVVAKALPSAGSVMLGQKVCVRVERKYRDTYTYRCVIIVFGCAYVVCGDDNFVTRVGGAFPGRRFDGLGWVLSLLSPAASVTAGYLTLPRLSSLPFFRVLLYPTIPVPALACHCFTSCCDRRSPGDVAVFPRREVPGGGCRPGFFAGYFAGKRGACTATRTTRLPYIIAPHCCATRAYIGGKGGTRPSLSTSARAVLLCYRRPRQ